MKLGVSYGLTSGLARKNRSGKSEGFNKSGKLERGELSLCVPFPRRCPGFDLALMEIVFLQQHNPPFCFPSSHGCTLGWWLGDLTSYYYKKGSCSICWRSWVFDKYFLLLFLALKYSVLFVSIKLYMLAWFCCVWLHCCFVHVSTE